PFGNKSPAGLLWAFVGYSVPYQMFSGVVESFGALLLLTRRTVALGALVCLVSTANVVLLNFCYDVHADALEPASRHCQVAGLHPKPVPICVPYLVGLNDNALGLCRPKFPQLDNADALSLNQRCTVDAAAALLPAPSHTTPTITCDPSALIDTVAEHGLE